MGVIVLLAMFAIQGRSAPQPARAAAPPVPSTRLAALFKRLGIDLQIYSRLAGVRSPAPETVGTLLLALDTSTGREQLLAAADRLWSPVSWPDGRIFFVADDGIRAVAGAPASDKQAAPARVSLSTPAVLFGAAANDPATLIAAERIGTGADCRVYIRSIRVGSGEPLRPVSEENLPCVRDDSLWIRAALRVSGNRLVSPAVAGPPVLLLAMAGPDKSFRDVEHTPITIVSPIAGVTSRVDPVWASPDRIVYVGSR